MVTLDVSFLLVDFHLCWALVINSIHNDVRADRHSVIDIGTMDR